MNNYMHLVNFMVTNKAWSTCKVVAKYLHWSQTQGLYLIINLEAYIIIVMCFHLRVKH